MSEDAPTRYEPDIEEIQRGQRETGSELASVTLLCIDREQLLTSLYLGVQRSLYAMQHPQIKEVLPGMHITHYHQSTRFQMDVDMIVNSILAAMEAKMHNDRTHAPRIMSKRTKQALPIKAQRGSRLRAVSGSAPSLDDWMEAYEEAAGHLEYLSGIQTDHTPGEREAKRRLAKRLRSSASRMAQNEKGQP